MAWGSQPEAWQPMLWLWSCESPDSITAESAARWVMEGQEGSTVGQGAESCRLPPPTAPSAATRNIKGRSLPPPDERAANEARWM